MSDFARARRTMVECQIRPNDVTNHAIIAAFLNVAREDFVPEAQRAISYSDSDIPLGHQRALLKPMVLAKLIHLAKLEDGMSALMVGGATGYGAAVVSQMGVAVTLLESDPSLAATARTNGVSVVEGALPAGVAAKAPFDAIIIEGAVETGFDALVGQLKDGGRLVAVIGRGGASEATVITRSGDATSRRVGFNAAAPLLPGFEKKAEFVF